MIVIRQHPSSRFFPRVQFRQEPARGFTCRLPSNVLYLVYGGVSHAFRSVLEPDAPRAPRWSTDQHGSFRNVLRDRPQRIEAGHGGLLPLRAPRLPHIHAGAFGQHRWGYCIDRRKVAVRSDAPVRRASGRNDYRIRASVSGRSDPKHTSMDRTAYRAVASG